MELVVKVIAVVAMRVIEVVMLLVTATGVEVYEMAVDVMIEGAMATEYEIEDVIVSELMADVVVADDVTARADVVALAALMFLPRGCLRRAVPRP